MAASILIVAGIEDEHARRVAEALTRRGADWLALDPRDLPSRATLTLRPTLPVSGTIEAFGHRPIPLDAVSAVLARPTDSPQPGPWSADPPFQEWTRSESRVALEALLDALAARWLPARPGVTRAAASKPRQLAAAGRSGLRTPRSLVTNDPDAFAAFYGEHGGRIVSKTLQARRADVDGQPRFAFTHAVRRRDATNLLALRNGPVLLQERVDKRAEIRATIVAGEVFAGEVDSQSGASTRDDWRRMADPPLDWRRHTLPTAVIEALTKLHASLGLALGCVDLILTPGGDYVFLETNPLGDWLFLEERLGLPITEAVAGFLCAGGTSA